MKSYLWRNMASSRAHLKLDSWWPKPSQDSQCFPGQSIRFPQYKNLSFTLKKCRLRLCFWVRFFNLKIFWIEFEDGKEEDPLVEIREEKRKRKAMAERETKKKMSGDLGLGFGFWVLGNAMEFAEWKRKWNVWRKSYWNSIQSNKEML